MREMGAYDIKFSGGEITLRDDLSEIIQHARKKYLNVVLLNNMYKLDRNVIDCIKEYGIGSIETTIFSLQEDIHDEFVGVKGALKATLNNIHMLKLIGINILVKTWVIKKNFHELETMSEFFMKNGYNFNIHTQIYDNLKRVRTLPPELELNKKEYVKALYLSDKSLRRKFPLYHQDESKLCKEFSSSLSMC